jgi:predicted nucleic acid-binding protein
LIVADTNLVLYLLLPGPFHAAALRWAELEPQWVVPPLWRYEFTSAVNSYLRAGEVELSQGRLMIQRASQLLAEHERPVDQLEVLDLSLKTRLHPFDATYIVLAQRLDVVCVTNDRQMLERAPRWAKPLTRFPETGA